MIQRFVALSTTGTFYSWNNLLHISSCFKTSYFCLRVDFHCRVIFTCVYTHVKMREVERGSPFTLTRDLVHIASLVFANVNLTHVQRKNYAIVEIHPYGRYWVVFQR